MTTGGGGGGGAGGDGGAGGGGGDTIWTWSAAWPWLAASCTVWAACCTTPPTLVGCCKLWVVVPATTFPEIVAATPLLATIVSVGIVRAPPERPGWPSSCARIAVAAPGGAAAGAEGAAPRP